MSHIKYDYKESYNSSKDEIDLKTSESLNTKQNLSAFEYQIEKYEADIRNHISTEYQMQI